MSRYAFHFRSGATLKVEVPEPAPKLWKLAIRDAAVGRDARREVVFELRERWEDGRRVLAWYREAGS